MIILIIITIRKFNDSVFAAVLKSTLYIDYLL